MRACSHCRCAVRALGDAAWRRFQQTRTREKLQIDQLRSAGSVFASSSSAPRSPSVRLARGGVFSTEVGPGGGDFELAATLLRVAGADVVDDEAAHDPCGVAHEARPVGNDAARPARSRICLKTTCSSVVTPRAHGRAVTGELPRRQAGAGLRRVRKRRRTPASGIVESDLGGKRAKIRTGKMVVLPVRATVRIASVKRVKPVCYRRALFARRRREDDESSPGSRVPAGAGDGVWPGGRHRLRRRFLRRRAAEGDGRSQQCLADRKDTSRRLRRLGTVPHRGAAPGHLPGHLCSMASGPISNEDRARRIFTAVINARLDVGAPDTVHRHGDVAPRRRAPPARNHAERRFREIAPTARSYNALLSSSRRRHSDERHRERDGDDGVFDSAAARRKGG